jgi:hypothetical protein
MGRAKNNLALKAIGQALFPNLEPSVSYQREGELYHNFSAYISPAAAQIFLD